MRTLNKCLTKNKKLVGTLLLAMRGAANITGLYYVLKWEACSASIFILTGIQKDQKRLALFVHQSRRNKKMSCFGHLYWTNIVLWPHAQ